MRINDAGRAADVVPPLLADDALPPVTNDDDVGFGGGRFSLTYSISMGASCLIETRFSVLALPECFRIESRRDIIGDLSDGTAAHVAAADDDGINFSIESRRDKFGELLADGQPLCVAGGRNAKSVLSKKRKIGFSVFCIVFIFPKKIKTNAYRCNMIPQNIFI